MSSSDALQKIQRELINNFESTPMKIFSYVVLTNWSLVAGLWLCAVINVWRSILPS